MIAGQIMTAASPRTAAHTSSAGALKTASCLSPEKILYRTPAAAASSVRNIMTQAKEELSSIPQAYTYAPP